MLQTKILSIMIVARMILTIGLLLVPSLAFAQKGGPFDAHPGLQITRAYTSQYGPDAEEYNVIKSVTPRGVAISYRDTRGIAANRLVLSQDRQASETYLIGFDSRLPQSIPGTTSLGISSATLQLLRRNGVAPLRLMYDRKLSTIPGVLHLVNDDVRLPVIVENQVVEMRALIARGSFQKGNRSGTGYFTFLSDVKHPVLLHYNIRFSWEKALRTTRTVRVSAGRSQQGAMEQTLRTLRRLDLYGIHFDFDKATIQPRSRQLIGDIATSLKNNRRWKIEIRGHTDAIGKRDYNIDLSARRARAVRDALVRRHKINPARLSTVGVGMNEPKASNKTLAGRAQNRRVELARTDR
jgi:outer membrane protein OmpA-like peptidoglycan-associated protein